MKIQQVIKWYLLLLSMLTMLSCTRPPVEPIDDEMMIKVPESQLYVRMRGNAQKPLIVNLHGGPGGFSGIDIKVMGPYLEGKYLVAYLDQRGCGKSLECRDTSLLNMEQYVEDLNIVMDSLRRRYPGKKINLMGTSWGGMYGFLYMLKYPGNINAYACIDGKVNSEYQNHSLIDYELLRANALLQSNSSDSTKNELRQIISELNRIKNSNFDNFHEDVNWIKHEVPPKLGFNAYYADTSKIISFEEVLKDTALLNLMHYTEEELISVGEKAEIVNRAFRNNAAYNNLNIEQKLVQITTPTAVIQGDRDYVVGLGHAQLIYDALTSLPASKKELHIIGQTGHSPAIEAPGELAEILISFFDKYNP